MRKRNSRKAQGKRGESELIGRDSQQPEAGSESTPATSSNKPRPRARPLNRAKTHPHATPGSSPRLQNTDELQTAVSEATAVGTMESAHASLPTQGSEKEDSEGTQQLPRKRPNRAPEVHYADKRRKSKDVFMHLQVLANKTIASGTDTPLASESKLDQPIRRTATAPTRVQPKRSSRS